MLLRHAFDDQQAVRVQLKTDLRNVQSQRAIEKLAPPRGSASQAHDLPRRPRARHRHVQHRGRRVAGSAQAAEERLGYVP